MMKILTWAEMMTMPPGTIYQDYKPRIVGPVMILGEVMLTNGKPVDYVVATVTPEGSNVSSWGQYEAGLREKYALALEAEEIVSYPTGFGRDGYFETNRLYLVWEEADRKKIAEWLLDPAKCLAEMNDDPHALVVVTEAMFDATKEKKRR